VNGPVAPVPGHGLQREGAAFDDRGQFYGRHRRDGYGFCACGAHSLMSLDSNAKRQRWHRAHKSAVLAERRLNRWS
jgi:hypothetical protein